MPVFLLKDKLGFPSPRLAEDGLLAVGGDLSRERLLLAYSMGIFPWYSEGYPILWWSPDPRLVLFPDEFHVSRSLRRLLRSGRFEVTADTAFEDILRACAETRYAGRESTWITPEMAEAYCGLHRAGYAHSVECWDGGVLAGGLYGVQLGRCFFGESMFSRVSNASKVALAALVERAKRERFAFIDCQVTSDHLLGLGAREIPRDDFLAMLAEHVRDGTTPGPWMPRDVSPDST